MKKYIPQILVFIVKAISFTYRYRYYGLENRKAALKKGRGSYTFGLFHKNLLPGIMGHCGIEHVTLVSPSKDGEIAATACREMGYTPVRGSSSRGGKKAMEEMIEIMNKRRIPAAITVDGPKGPIHEPKNGAFIVSNKAESPILPMCVLSEYQIVFKSWDRFRLPLPLSKVYIYYAEPINIVGDLDEQKLKSYKLELKEKLFDGEEYIRTNLFTRD